MSVYNKPDIKLKIGANASSFIHKKTNSLSFSSNTGKFLQDNSNKVSENKLQLKNTSKDNIENNVINNYESSNINKLLTTTNKSNKKIEININKNYSPTSRLNKSGGENIILLKHKHSTSQYNINNNKRVNDANNKKCNIIINNNINNNVNDTKDKNNNKNKNLNNINININISKKIISTYYNKSKDKSNIIIKKKSINSMNNSGAKDNDNNNKYYRIYNKEVLKHSNNENIIKNQSANALKKISNNEISMNNISQNKNSLNLNSLGYFSTNSNMSTNTNKNKHYSKTNLNNSKTKNNHINYTSNDIYNINNSNDKDNNNKKSQGIMFNKIIKENKSMYLSQIQIPVNSSSSPKNINSIQNYLKYLHIGQNSSKYNKNSPYDRTNKNQKLSENNIIFKHNNTENNAMNITYNYEYNNALTQNNHKYNKKNVNDIPKGENINKIKKESNKTTGKRRNRVSIHNTNYSNSIYENKALDTARFECPEQLHYFYVKMFQKGKNINFDKKK